MWFLIRHGETMHNRLKISQGHYSSLLTLRGIDQIKSIAYRLQKTKEDFNNYTFISSPMVRTRHSMQIIQEILNIVDKKEVIEEKLIEEINQGTFTNIKKSIIEKNYPELFKERENNYWCSKYPEGESREEVFERMQKFVEKYKDEKNLVIVGHGCLLKMLKCILLKTPKNIITTEKTDQNYFLCWNGTDVVRM